MRRDIVIARFHDQRPIVDAVRAARSCGLRIADVYSPYPIHGLDEVMGLRRSRLPAMTLAGGIAGLAAALALELYTSVVDWPLNVGGKPDASWLAFVPIAFELTILGAGLATAAGLLVASRLAPFRDARILEPAATDDTFALVVHCRESAFDRQLVEQLLLNHGAHSVESTVSRP